MGVKTGIEWCDSTWSPIRVRVRTDAAEIAQEKGYTSLLPIAEKMAGRVGQHCEHVSPGCKHCYAETMNHRRLPGNGTGLPYDRRSRDLIEAFVDEKALLQPLKWGAVTLNGEEDKVQGHHLRVYGARGRRIFVENQSDLFGEWITNEMLDRIFAVMALCPQHTFQVLTKRPERMRKYCEQVTFERLRVWMNREMYPGAPNVGTLARRAKLGTEYEFKRVPAPPLPNVWLGVSVEDQETADERIPLLLQTPAVVRFLSVEPLLAPVWLHDCAHSPKLDWVICGGESGSGARPMHPDWARSVRDQCLAADVPFFFKQWGEWLGAMQDGAPREGQVINASDEPQRVGKKAAGSLLDGREWKQFPENAR